MASLGDFWVAFANSGSVAIVPYGGDDQRGDLRASSMRLLEEAATPKGEDERFGALAWN